MDAKRRKIIEHRMENMIINHTPVVPPYGGLIALLRDEFTNPGHRVPPIDVSIGAMFDTK